MLVHVHQVTAPSIKFSGSRHTVELTTPTAGATIYYTVDGSDPKIEGTRCVDGWPRVLEMEWAEIGHAVDQESVCGRLTEQEGERIDRTEA